MRDQFGDALRGLRSAEEHIGATIDVESEPAKPLQVVMRQAEALYATPAPEADHPATQPGGLVKVLCNQAKAIGMPVGHLLSYAHEQHPGTAKCTSLEQIEALGDAGAAVIDDLLRQWAAIRASWLASQEGGSE